MNVISYIISVQYTLNKKAKSLENSIGSTDI